MRLIRYIIPAIAAAAFASCEKEIDFKYHDIPEQQVIEWSFGKTDQDGRDR